MELTTGWTGRTACALQAALRLSNESFAEHLGIGVRTVATWHQKPDLRPKPEMQQLLDTALERASSAVKKRFATLVSDPAHTTDLPHTVTDSEHDSAAISAELRLAGDPNIAAALAWLDDRAGWQPGTARRKVASRLARTDARALQDRARWRSRVNQRRVAEALSEYYPDRPGSHGQYGVHCGSEGEALTSVLTCPEWLDLDCPLIATNDRLGVSGTSPTTDMSLDQDAAEYAVQRLTETLALDVRLVDTPIYRLLDINVRQGAIGGLVGVVPFVEYALTMDLLESELVDALAADLAPRLGSLPLRDKHLPDVASVLDVSHRLCGGGALALCAIARPASHYQDRPDYLLLVQERSGNVINASRRLAVIPKAFHEPLTDLRADAQIGATLRREMEEELFGRDDLDSTVANRRRADPMHPSRLSEPMGWLLEGAGQLRMECTGFALNLVSGNYEFACLVVIEDEEFWSRYGGHVEGNWESSTLRQYSSLDRELLSELICDVAWSNEGLFALLQGLRRLRHIGGNRVNLPAIEWKIR
jgi:hypothetical protein